MTGPHSCALPAGAPGEVADCPDCGQCYIALDAFGGTDEIAWIPVLRGQRAQPPAPPE